MARLQTVDDLREVRQRFDASDQLLEPIGRRRCCRERKAYSVSYPSLRSRGRVRGHVRRDLRVRPAAGTAGIS